MIHGGHIGCRARLARGQGPVSLALVIPPRKLLLFGLLSLGIVPLVYLLWYASRRARVRSS